MEPILLSAQSIANDGKTTIVPFFADNLILQNSILTCLRKYFGFFKSIMRDELSWILIKILNKMILKWFYNEKFYKQILKSRSF